MSAVPLPDPIRFCLYARTSTTDQQSPTDSLAWQRSRAESLIVGHGEIVEVVHDVGQSRSVPWKRRPEAMRLLNVAANPRRGWDAIVFAEPARAFSGGQANYVLPILQHHGIDVWLPEVGGALDYGSEAHDLVLSLYGSLSKAERNRIKLRVKTAMTQQASEGRWLGGRPPFGYTLADVGPHPNPSKAKDGKRLRRLVPHPEYGPVVTDIFTRFAAGSTVGDIIDWLHDAEIPCPSQADPRRNPHRRATGWKRPTIKAMLENPTYTGKRPWGRVTKSEDRLIDVTDVSLGHSVRRVDADPDDWVWSGEDTYEALVNPETWTEAQRRLATRQKEAPRRTKSRTGLVYPTSGLLVCGICGRRMEAHGNSQRRYMRCKASDKDRRADPNLARHPSTVYVREERLVERVDEWIAGWFEPDRFEDTVAALTNAAVDESDAARAENARRIIADCDKTLANYRKLLATTDDEATIAQVGSWISESMAERDAASRLVAETAEYVPGEDEIRAMLAELNRRFGTLATALAKADPEAKKGLYAALSLNLVFDPDTQEVSAEARPWAVPGDAAASGELRVGGGT